MSKREHLERFAASRLPENTYFTALPKELYSELLKYCTPNQYIYTYNNEYRALILEERLYPSSAIIEFQLIKNELISQDLLYDISFRGFKNKIVSSRWQLYYDGSSDILSIKDYKRDEEVHWPMTYQLFECLLKSKLL